MQGSWLVSSSAWEARGRSWHADCSPARLSPPVHSVLRESSPEPGLSPLESFLTAELFSEKLSPHCLHRKPVCVCVYVRVCLTKSPDVALHVSGSFFLQFLRNTTPLSVNQRLSFYRWPWCQKSSGLVYQLQLEKGLSELVIHL